jgi:ribokinase
MTPILVAGLINIETTVRIDAFPIVYAPVHYPFFGVHSSVSGVGYNIAKALTTLGDEVTLLSLIGQDLAGASVAATLRADQIAGEGVLAAVPHTAQSVVLYEPGGRRQIHVDLKDIQERSYPAEHFQPALARCDLAVLCNANFTRAFLGAARAAGMPLACDVHAIASLDDDYNRDYMQAADVLFMSDERLPEVPEAWAEAVMARYGPQVLVIGLGAQGALLAVKRDGFVGRLPAVSTRPVVNTIGAGDALFSAFVHGYAAGLDPYRALRRAMVFASYKIGATSAADGFLTAGELAHLASTLDV